MLQVIWAIGVSMIVLAACQFLGRKVCLMLGALIVLGHNALDGVWPAQQDLWRPQPAAVVGAARVLRQGDGAVLRLQVYPLLPWIGVMLLGFGAAVLFEKPAAARERALLCWGIAHHAPRSWCCACWTCTASQPLAEPGAAGAGAPCSIS